MLAMARGASRTICRRRLDTADPVATAIVCLLLITPRLDGFGVDDFPVGHVRSAAPRRAL